MKSKYGIIIITAAILTSMPRWIIALLAGEGILVPAEWKSLWIVISALLAASMAVVEGFAFAYIFQAWRAQSGKAADTLLWLAIASAVAFVFTLSPSMAASVRGITMDEFMQNDIVLLLWTTSVALSTILIVVAVGYSEKVVNVDPKLQQARVELKELRAKLKSAQATDKSAQEWAWLWNGSPKKERVNELTRRYPKMPTKAVAMLCDTSDTYASQNRWKRD